MCVKAATFPYDTPHWADQKGDFARTGYALLLSPDWPPGANEYPSHTHHMAKDHKQVKTLQRCQIFFSFLNESALTKDL